MQFHIPQFIDIEDKIFGPLSFKQFIYAAGGIGISIVLYRMLPLFIALFFIAPILVLSGLLAFYKINNRPFIDVLESGFKFLFQGKLYVWKKREKLPQKKEEVPTRDGGDIFVPRLSESKLKDIAWSLDVEESIYSERDARNKES